MVSGKLDSHLQKNEAGPQSSTKVNSKWMEVSNTRPETIKLLEEITGCRLLDIGLGSVFLDLTPNAKATKAKISKWDYIKLKSICTAKEITKK